jgi:hypothetical protein
MNSHEKTSAGPNDETTTDAQKSADPNIPSSGQAGMVAVAKNELGKVEGGYGIGTRTGDPSLFFRPRH